MMKKNISFLSKATLTLALIMICATAWAENVETYYIDENGTRHDVTATVLTGNEQYGSSGHIEFGTSGETSWYVVNSNINYEDDFLYIVGTVNLILADGCTMSVVGHNRNALWGSRDSRSLTIYGQTLGSGTLEVSTKDDCTTAIFMDHDFVICGGTVNATGSTNAIEAGSVTISGGTVNATGGQYGYGIRSFGDVQISGGKVTATAGQYGYGIRPDYEGTITIGCTRAADFIYASSYYDSVVVADGQILTDGTTTYSGTLNYVQWQAFGGKTLTSYDFSKTGTNEYTINTPTGWGMFCDALNGDESFSEKTVKLGDDITITRMASSTDPCFRGTFDGQGHTLTLNYGTANDPIDAQFIAPFVMTYWNTSPTFRNLTIDGHIYEAYTGSEAHNVGGLIGHLYGDVTIEHCTSNVEITSTGGAGGFVGLCEHTVNFTDCLSSAVVHSADGNNSGFVSWSRASGYAINFTGCLFNGKLLQQNGSGHSNGGFIGWTGSNKTVTITNCLYAPAALAEGEAYASDNSATFARGWNESTTATNCYYTTDFNDGTHNTGQGKQRRSITAGENVTVAYAGTATVYATSGITSYGTGIKYDNVLYAGSDDAVSLTLGNTPPTGYGFSGYTASAGTLTGTANPYTLTMPDDNVVIGATFLAAVSYSYIDGNGEEQTRQPSGYRLLTGSETSLDSGWYVLASNLDYSNRLYVSGDVHLILCDGCEMNADSGINVSEGNSLNIFTIYAQSTGENIGILNSYSWNDYYSAGIGGDQDQSCGTITINGGKINAMGGFHGAGIGGGYGGTGGIITINGGIIKAYVNASSDNEGGGAGIGGGTRGSAGNITINGGKIEAEGGYDGDNGINGTVTLSYTNSTDSYYASSFVGDVTIEEGKAFITDDATPVILISGLVSDNSLINGKTLRPYNPAITLASATIFGESKYVGTFFSSAQDFQLPEGARAYTASLDGTKVVFHQIGDDGRVIPHGTAAIVVADAANITLTTTSTTVSAYAGNILQGSDTALAKPAGTVYVLGVDNGGVPGFYTFTGSTIPAGKAYYVVD